MTYCLGVVVREGLVLAADSRTNAGVDYISSYQKLFEFEVPGERVLVLCTSGNLSMTQAVLYRLQRDIKTEMATSLFTVPTIYDAARYVGQKVREQQEQDRSWLEKDGLDYQGSFLLGGQIVGDAPELYLIYSQGNCIRAMPETPFLQIGETKYGKPILDRAVTFESSLDAIAKCALLSIDSTMRSNISVGPPINLVMYKTDALQIQHRMKLKSGDPYLIKIRTYWESALREASAKMPDIEWDCSARPIQAELD
jgi:putative proteasome-type protease